ncbi:hypothetical protein F6476_06055 [Pseudomonas umsongensis]|nr:hypothetical protein F6476_06055 [Pseudomonas umsongensis]
MVVNDDEGYLNARVVLAFFASMLAPTGVAAMGHPWPRVCKNRLKHRSARSADRCRTDDQTCNARTATSGPAIASEAPLLV